MKHIKTYKQLNEGLRDKMLPKSEEDIKDSIKNTDKFETMTNAIMYNMINIVTELIEKGYNVERMGNHALKSAVAYGHLEIAELLLKSGADVNVDNEKCLRLSAHKQNKEMFELLLNYGADLDKAKTQPPIENHLAVVNYNIPPSLYFLNNYPNVNEGLRDKMVGPSDEELLSSLNKLPDNERILKIFKYHLDLNLLPRDEDGWCVLTDDYTPHYYNNIIPDKFKVIGSFYASGSEDITELPNDLYVKDDFILSGSKITEIPDGLYVGKNLVINRNKIEKLPDNLTVKGDLELSSNELTQLPKNLTIKGGFSCNWNKLVEIPGDLVVEGDVNFNVNNIKKINKGVKFGGNVDILGNQITKLPDDLLINGTLNLMDNKLTKLPKGLILKGDLVIMGNKINKLPEDLIVEGTLYIDSEFKKMINIPKGVNNIL